MTGDDFSCSGLLNTCTCNMERYVFVSTYVKSGQMYYYYQIVINYGLKLNMSELYCVYNSFCTGLLFNFSVNIINPCIDCSIYNFHTIICVILHCLT